ncbi:MAG: hypothetical protein WCQ95_00185 [Bacteroidota bacterium]
MKTANYNFSKLSQPKFIEFVGLICFCLTGNTNFPTLPFIATAIATKLADYEKALDKAARGDSVSVQTARNLRKVIEGMLKKDVIYINDVAQGDLEILESCGFILSKDRKTPTKPVVKVVDSSQSGTGKIIINPVEGAITYLVEICPDPLPAEDNTTVWNRLPMVTRHYLWAMNLEPFKLYWLRFCCATVDGETDYVGPFSFRVS